jgi:glycosyltransferase involved in cell wall biosynthesis
MLVIEDSWNLTNYMVRKPRDLPAVAYVPVDCPNIRWNHAMGLAAYAEVASYTRFGAVELASSLRDTVDIFWESHRNTPEAQESSIGYMQYPSVDGELLDIRMDRLNRYQNPSNWNVIPHGHTPGVFEPRDRKAARAMFGFPEDAFIVLNVNANRNRKRLDLTIRAFAGLHQKRKDALLVLHAGTGDEYGWDLLQLARYYGIEGRIACVHYRAPTLTDDQLCWLYNTADVQINTSGGEGWGLTSIEGAACGIPQMTPDWSTGREIWENHGWLLKVADWRNEPRLLNTAHAAIDTQAAARDLELFATDEGLRSTYSQLALEQAARQVGWDDVGDAFDTLVQRALNESAPTPMGFSDVLANREAGVQSALRNKPFPTDL